MFIAGKKLVFSLSSLRFLFVFFAEAKLKIAPYICTLIKYFILANQSARYIKNLL